MPRTARASIGGIRYHVLNRGNALQDVFHEDDDHQRFIELIQEACARVPMRSWPGQKSRMSPFSGLLITYLKNSDFARSPDSILRSVGRGRSYRFEGFFRFGFFKGIILRQDLSGQVQQLAQCANIPEGQSPPTIEDV